MPGLVTGASGFVGGTHVAEAPLALGERGFGVDAPAPCAETFAGIAAVAGLAACTPIEKGVPCFAEWSLAWRGGRARHG